MNELWELIQMKARIIERIGQCIGFLPDMEEEPQSVVLRRMLAAERDHLAALKYLYDVSAKEKAETAMTDFARDAVKDYKEKTKLIK